MVGKNEQASSAKFFSGTTRRATEGSPQRDKPTGSGGGAAAGRSPAARARRARAALRKQRAAAPPWPAGCGKRWSKKNSPAGWRGREELDHYLRSVGALAASTRFSALVTRLSREVANSG